MANIREVLIEATKIGGEIVMQYFGHIRERDISYKETEFTDTTNLVTEADTKSEAAIIETIQKYFPDHSFLAEESGTKSATSSPYRWIIDPLDGTTNFAHGFPVFAISVALQFEGELVIGAVYDPTRREFFFAQQGKGAFLNGQQIKTSKCSDLNYAMLATGFPYDVRMSAYGDNLDYFTAFMLKSQAVRRPGSAALDLAYLACGRIDGFWELKLKPWDTAAGVLLVREAGGIAENYRREHYNVEDNDIVAAGNRTILDQMHNVIDCIGKDNRISCIRESVLEKLNKSLENE